MSLATDLLRNQADHNRRPWRGRADLATDFQKQLADVGKSPLEWSDDLARVVLDGAHASGVRRMVVERGVLQKGIGAYVKDLDWQAWSRVGEVAAPVAELGDVKAAEKLLRCHDPSSGFIEFCPEDFAHHHKFHPERCWLRICPSCAKEIAERLRVRYAARIEKVMAQKVQSWSLKHVVLTMRRQGELKAQLELLHSASKRTFKHFWGDDIRAGAFGSAELGSEGGNPHAHLGVYGRWVAQKDLSDYWFKLTGNPVVFIRQVEPAAVAEIIKYCAKFTNSNGSGDFALSTADLVALHFALKGKRRVWSWGSFYGVGDDVEHDDLRADVCPECGHALAWLSRSDARALLQFTSVINCSVRAWPAALATGPPGALT